MANSIIGNAVDANAIYRQRGDPQAPTARRINLLKKEVKDKGKRINKPAAQIENTEELLRCTIPEDSFMIRRCFRDTNGEREDFASSRLTICKT